MFTHGINVGGVMVLEIGPKGQRPVNSLVFPANPDVVKTINMRTTVVQTLHGIYVDRFGPGIQTLALQGTTAWASQQGRFNGQYVDGNDAARNLYKDIFLTYENEVLKSQAYQMRFYNDVTQEAFVVEPVATPQFQRTAQSTLVEYFSFQLVVLADLMTGHQVQKAVDAVIGTFTSPKSIKTYAKSKVTSAQVSTIAQKQTPYVRRQVQSGDTLYSIAQDYLPLQATSGEVDTFVNSIVALNNLGNANLLFDGLILRIPA